MRLSQCTAQKFCDFQAGIGVLECKYCLPAASPWPFVEMFWSRSTKKINNTNRVSYNIPLAVITSITNIDTCIALNSSINVVSNYKLVWLIWPSRDNRQGDHYLWKVPGVISDRFQIMITQKNTIVFPARYLRQSRRNSYYFSAQNISTSIFLNEVYLQLIKTILEVTKTSSPLIDRINTQNNSIYFRAWSIK